MISKPSMFILRCICVYTDEFRGDNPLGEREAFSSLDIAQMMASGGHDLDFKKSINELVKNGLLDLVENSEETGGLGYYSVTTRGQALGLPEKFGSVSFQRFVDASGPATFTLRARFKSS